MQLSELRPYTQGYSVCVRVVAKNVPERIFAGRLLHQIIIVEDDQGSRMRAVLFGDRVDDLEEKMQLNSCYEITDAPIVASETPWKSAPNELNYQLHLSAEVQIRQLSGAPSVKYVLYKSIAEIQAAGVGSDYVDVLGIVLYLEPEARTITGTNGRASTVRELVLTDPSCEEPLFISLIDELARRGCPAIPISAPDFAVVSFMGMLTTADKGFSLSTSMITVVNKFPVGQVPDDMRKWVAENKLELTTRRNNLLRWLGLPTVRSFDSVCNLRTKTAQNTQHGETFWVKIVFPCVEMNQIDPYIGCSICEGPTTKTVGAIYNCNFCLGQFCQARICLSFIGLIADESGTIPVKSSTQLTELIFRMPIPDIFRMVSCNHALQFHRISTRLQATPLYIRVSGCILNSKFPCILWNVIEVEFVDPTEQVETPGPPHSGPQLPEAVVKSVNSFNDVHEAFVGTDRQSPFM